MVDIYDFRNDALHGRIGLTEVEYDLVQTPAFLRLGRIRQLGLSHLVFPSATHTRFSHSLGSLEILGRLSRRLDIGADDEQDLRLAALLHDIGQYPFSHAVESVYQRLGGPNPWTRRGDPREDVVVDLPPTRPFLLAATDVRSQEASGINDKSLGAFVVSRDPAIRAVLTKHGYGDRIERLAKFVSGQYPSTLFTQLLNSDFDCDRLDYLMRDSLHCGVPFGRVDLDYLIECCVSKPAAPGSDDRVLAIKKRRGLHVVEHLLTGRYYMYAQVYYHRRVRAYELMLGALAIELSRRGSLFKNFAAICEAVEVEPERFYAFDDYELLAHVRGYAAADDADRHLRSMALGLIGQGGSLTLIEEFTTVDPQSDQRYVIARNHLKTELNLQALCDRASVDRQLVIVQDLGTSFVPTPSSLSPKDVLASSETLQEAYRLAPRLFDEDGDDETKVELLVEDTSTVIRALANLRPRVLRMYTVPGEDGELIRDKLKPQLRSAIGA